MQSISRIRDSKKNVINGYTTKKGTPLLRMFVRIKRGVDSNGFRHIQLQKFRQEFTPPNRPEFVQFTLHIQGKKTIGSSYDTLDSIGDSVRRKNPRVFQLGFSWHLKFPHLKMKESVFSNWKMGYILIHPRKNTWFVCVFIS